MSSGGALAALAVPPATPTPVVRRKVVTENWDDDFEFSLPVKPKRPAPPKGLTLGSSARDNSLPLPLDSPDSFDEDWDDPGPSRNATGLRSPSSSTLPMRSNSHKHSASLLKLPRSSPSQSPTLSPSLRRPPPAQSSSSPNNPRADMSVTPVRTPNKRIPASFTKSDSGDLSLHSVSPAHKSSPNLVDSHRWASRVRRTSMQPSRPQSPTKGVLKSPGKSPVKELRQSSSSEQLKKSKFWKRLSGGAATNNTATTPPRRPRSLSTGNSSTPGPPDDAPPVPPLPPNLKTPSVGSSSAISTMSSSPSSASKSPVQRLSAMLRRSSSNLSTALKKSSPSPPPLPNAPHPYAFRNGHESSASVSTIRHDRESSPPMYVMRHGQESVPSVYAAMLRAQESSPSVYAIRPAQESSPSVYAMRRAQESSPSVYAMRHAQESSPSVYALRNGYGSGASVVSPIAGSTSSVNVTLGPSSGKAFSGGLRHSASRQSLVPNTMPGRPTTPRRPSPIKVGQSDASGPRTFSPGFHLPNTVAGSPYHAVSPPLPLVASTSRTESAGSDTEMEDDGSTTPRRRRRVRPASVQPPPRELSNARFKDINASVPALGADQHQHQRPEVVRIPSSSISSQSLNPPTDATSPATATQHHPSANNNGFGHTTLKRITSFSKKHGRRLSEGWKFGSTSSTSSIESEVAIIQQAQVHRLEPVAGSPSKLPTMDKGKESIVDIGSPTTKEHPPIPPVPPALASGSDPLPSQPKISPVRKAKQVEAEVWDDWDEPATTARKRPRERRRMSFGDFVIPDSVLAKQKELKRGIGAVKKFAGGVDALKTLVESHDRVCNYILEKGSQSETRLFVALENEYAQWWEMATVLIEVGSTGTDGASGTPVSNPNPRRVTLATEDARAATEALRQASGSSMNSFTTTATSASGESGDVFQISNGPPRASPPPEFGRASTGRHDLSKRQLEVLRTMLRTPVDRSESVVPSVDERHGSNMTTRRAKHMSMPAVPVSITPPPVPTPSRTLVASQTALDTPPLDGAYIFPSPGYPSPNTAAALAQPKKTGLAGLREFLRGLKKPTPPNNVTPTRPPGSKPRRRRPAPIDLQAVEQYTSPPSSPPTTSGPSDEFSTQRSMASVSGDRSPRKGFTTGKKRRPSLRNMFRPGSGNWSDLVRATPPASPFIDDNSSQPSLKDSTPSTPVRASPVLNFPAQLQRPPSIPALARLKPNGKPAYGVGIEENSRPARRPSERENGRVRENGNGTIFPDQPPTPTLGDAEVISAPPVPDETMRLKNRVRGLGLPSESSPSARVTSSPARSSEMLPPPGLDETPRSRSDNGPRAPDVIALTPENLPVLLDYVQQCERRLDEWRERADRIGAGG
ncbi:hypothetical protein CspeluHIS016_0602580 [Cutaneotrichosporon spelunceum]|uniref:Uncharacterized protein n=1 Tax=Cutaneotrichosporon spelunceum TaxID=1672016 RepID=A0AAD3TYE0_9TREE|nr:hypothetical protein CspeluHIS016_0602580 [Cutaneotrichosporon spelunceum]